VTLLDIERPRPVLDRERERQLTDRQRELLDHLGRMFDEGFADLTMAELASRLNCSLRTLYALASSRDELVLIVVDRNLWRIGRSAQSAIEPDLPPLDAVRRYLAAAHVAVMNTTEPFARDLAAVPAAQRLQEAHQDYLLAVTKGLLDAAVDRGDVAPIDTAAVARALSRVGADFAKPEVLGTIRSSPKDAADLIADLVLRGLERTDHEGAGQ
jgi:AcrR family transcriptional regulator